MKKITITTMFLMSMMNFLFGQEYPVQWKDMIGVAVEGNDLVKTASDGWTNSGAASIGEIPAYADGWVEATVSQTGKNMMIGLSQINQDADYKSIGYAAYVLSNSWIEVYESGSGKGRKVTYVPGDVIRVERTGGRILYKKNGTVFYVSEDWRENVGYLLADVALYTQGGRWNGVNMSCAQEDISAQREADLLNTEWYDFVPSYVNEVNINNGTISTTGTSEWASGSTSSSNRTNGDFAIKFTPVNSNDYQNVNLNFEDKNYSNSQMLLYNGTLTISTLDPSRSSGNVETVIPSGYNGMDDMMITRIAGILKFFQNGNLIFTAGKIHSGKVTVSFALAKNTARIENVKLSFGTTSQFHQRYTALNELYTDLEEQNQALLSQIDGLSQEVQDAQVIIDNQSQDITELSQQVDDLIEQNETLQQNLKSITQERDQLGNQVNALVNQVSLLQAENLEQEDMISQFSSQVDMLEMEVSGLEATVEELQSTINSMTTEMNNLENQNELLQKDLLGCEHQVDSLKMLNQSYASEISGLLVKIDSLMNISSDQIWDENQEGIYYDEGIVEIKGSGGSKVFSVMNDSIETLKIHSDGVLYAAEVDVTLDNFPDYVFDNDYKKMSLKDIEKFIKIHGHLPNIPNAKTVAADGIGLVELTRLQMEKIEELTMHIIEMNKKINSLKSTSNE